MNVSGGISLLLSCMFTKSNLLQFHLSEHQEMVS